MFQNEWNTSLELLRKAKTIGIKRLDSIFFCSISIICLLVVVSAIAKPHLYIISICQVRMHKLIDIVVDSWLANIILYRKNYNESRFKMDHRSGKVLKVCEH